jgi:Domain of unknown function (DUF4189)
VLPSVRTRALAAALIIAAPAPLAVSAVAQEMRAQSPAPWAAVPIRYGAIAFTADGSYSTAWKYRSKAAAQAKVASVCARFKRGVCQVVGFGAKVCAALASFETGKGRKVTYSGGALSPQEAQQQAMRRCKEDSRSGGRCELRVIVCADGR